MIKWAAGGACTGGEGTGGMGGILWLKGVRLGDAYCEWVAGRVGDGKGRTRREKGELRVGLEEGRIRLGGEGHRDGLRREAAKDRRVRGGSGWIEGWVERTCTSTSCSVRVAVPAHLICASSLWVAFQNQTAILRLAMLRLGSTSAHGWCR
eukprot:1588937-Rhodomonas_salina.2